jgi:hypothetical protein
MNLFIKLATNKITIFVLFLLIFLTFFESSNLQDDSENNSQEIKKAQVLEQNQEKNSFVSSPESQDIKIASFQEQEQIKQIKKTVENKKYKTDLFLEKIGFQKNKEFFENLKKQKNRNILVLEVVETGQNYRKQALKINKKLSSNLPSDVDVSVSYGEKISEEVSTSESTALNSSNSNSETQEEINNKTVLIIKDKDGNIISQDSDSFSEVSTMPIRITDGLNFSVNIPYKFANTEMIFSISNSKESQDFTLNLSSYSSGDVVFIEF